MASDAHNRARALPLRAGRWALLLATLLAGAVLAGPAASPAGASITKYSEPLYTKTATTNTYFWRWQAANGLNLDTNQTTYMWWMCYRTLRDNIVVEDSDGTKGWNSPNCWLVRSAASQPSTGDSYTYPFTSGTVLQDGSRWEMCTRGYHIYGFYNSYPSTALLFDNLSSACNASTIDRSKPSIATSVSGGAQYTNNPVLPLLIGYSDATSPPWFGADGRASNWTCVSRGAPCTVSATPDPNCSVPELYNSKVNRFVCQADLSAAADGTWYFCARAADAAVPDNPSGPDQFVGTSNQANLSDVACDAATLDRAPPRVTAAASATNVRIGTLVSFSATASDEASGINGAFEWDFGDNTPARAGAGVTHTYTQPGTYVARVTARDGATNPGQGTVTIVVGGDGIGGGSGDPDDEGDGGDVPDPGGSGGGPGQNEGSTGATGVQRPLPGSAISELNGGGGSQTTRFAGLRVVAPKRFRAGRTKLVIGLSATAPGSLSTTLRKGAKVAAKHGARLASAGSYRLTMKVPRALKPGDYRLRFKFTPAGGRPQTRSLPLRATRKRRAAPTATQGGSPHASKLHGLAAALGPDG